MTGLEGSGWKCPKVGLGRHGWKYLPPPEITSDYPAKWLTIQQTITPQIEKYLTQEIKRFYRLDKNGKQIHYTEQDAKQILSGNKASLN